MRAMLVAAALVVAARAVGADEARARALYQAGQTAFETGRFLDAASAFEQSYAESRRPALLWNIARSYHKQYEIGRDLVHLRRARVMYENFADLAPSPEEKTEAERSLAAVDEELRRAQAAPPPVPAPTVTPARPAPIDAVRLVPVAPTAAPEVPLYRRWWLWTVVGGVVVAGIATAVALALTLPDDASPPQVNGGSYMPVFR
jgi:hypothetical protein